MLLIFNFSMLHNLNGMLQKTKLYFKKKCKLLSLFDRENLLNIDLNNLKPNFNSCRKTSETKKNNYVGGKVDSFL